MESLMNDLRRSGADLTTAPSLRLASRPLTIFEDHGRTLVSRDNGPQNTRLPVSGVQKFKPAGSTVKTNAGATRSMGQGNTGMTTKIVDGPIELSDSHSEDEMDLLRNNGFTDENGVWHKYLKGFEPKRVIPTLRFKKNKGTDNANGELPDTSLSQLTSLPAPSLLSPSKGGNTFRSPSKSKCDATTHQRDTIYVNHRPLSSKDPNSRSEGRSRPSPSKPAFREKHPSEPKLVLEGMKIGPPSRSVRSRIKRVNKPGGTHPNGPSPSKKPSSSFPVALDDPPQYFDGHKSTKSRSRSSGMSRSRSRGRYSSPKVTVRKPEAFPALSPPTSPALPKRRPEFFPPLSPLADSKSQLDDLSKHQKRRANPFPILSPPSKGDEVEESRGRTRIKRMKGKGKTKENEEALLLTEPDDEDDAGRTIMVSSSVKNNVKSRALPADSGKEKTRRKPKRFPMSAQMLQSINSSPTMPTSRWGKRLSEGSGDERISKRSRKSSDALPLSPTRSFEEEGDSLLFSPKVDPRSLCPYCDTPLPDNPSSLLHDLIATTKKKASPDPRPSNPLGLKAAVTVFVTVCQRHRFESQILPEAEKKGWPKTIEWANVASRVMKMKNVLRALVEDGTEADVGWPGGVDDDWETPYGKKKLPKQKGPRANSIFWKEVVKEIKEKGSRVVAGLRGQFANFEKAQPGYYGEQGSVIIHQTLYDMFPPSSMDAGLVAPLTGNEFMEKILVPEVALRLIMEDRNLKGEEGKQEALTVLRESSSYGVFMFPEDGGEWCGRRRKAKDHQLGVGDMIVMQRAMKRRKEIEEEGKAEENERIMKSQETWRSNGNERKPAPTQPKPRPLRKGPTSMSLSSSQDDSSRFHLLPKQSRRDCDDTDPASGIETAVEISETETDGAQVSVRHGQRTPSARGLRSQRVSIRSTNRAISGLNLSSDSDASNTAMTRSKSTGVVCRIETRSSQMEVDRMFEDTIKTPAGLEADGTPKPPRSATPPLMRARRRYNNEPVVPFRQNSGTSRPPLPTRIHLSSQAQSGVSQDSRWLLEDESS